MAAYSYVYEVDYEPDINHALQALRQREFEAGRYNPAMPFPQSPFSALFPGSGQRYSSISAALAASDTDGTRSILDIDCVADEPDFSVAAPLTDEELEGLMGTTRPSPLDARIALDEILFSLERGHCVYVVCYEEEQPTRILFAGMSYD